LFIFFSPFSFFSDSKILLLRSTAASLLSDFLSCEPQPITFGDGLRLYHVSSIHDSTVRVNTSITCYAGYFAVHLLRKYTTMLGFLPLASSKIPLLRSAAASLLSDFLVVRSGETKCQLRCRLVSFLATKKPSEGFPPEGE